MTFRDTHPRLAPHFERELREICAVLSEPCQVKKKQLLFTIALPKLMKVSNMYNWLASRELREKGEDDETLHAHRQDLYDALLGIQKLFREELHPTEEVLAKLLQRCEEFLCGVIKTSTK